MISLYEQFYNVIEKAKNDIYNPLCLLKKSDLPVLIWGGGSLSVSVRKVLEANHIDVCGYLIDGATIKELNGLPVYSREKISSIYGSVNLVIGHAKYELETEILKENFVTNAVCITDVCYRQWDRTSADAVLKRIDEYIALSKMLEDDESIESLKALLACKISGRWQDIYPVVTGESYFNNHFFDVCNEYFLDLGAYDGDTIREYVKEDTKYGHIYAFEPEEASFNRLVKYVESTELDNVSMYKMGGWNEKRILHFSETEESSSISEKPSDSSIAVDRIDSILDGKKITLIKINYFAGVLETLDGCEKILKNQKPNIVITAGFDAFSVISYTETIKRLNPDYRIALRFGAAMPARLFLFAF